jgi:hypothetical protein
LILTRTKLTVSFPPTVRIFLTLCKVKKGRNNLKLAVSVPVNSYMSLSTSNVVTTNMLVCLYTLHYAFLSLAKDSQLGPVYTMVIK